MSEREIIPSCESGRDAICADHVDDGFVLSSFIAGDEDAQINLSLAAGRRLGEWLIERAGGAEKPEVVGLPMLVKNSRGWEVLGEDGARFRLALMSAAPFECASQAGER